MKTGKVAGVLACLCLGLLTACQQTKEGNPISSLPGPIIGVQNPNTEPGGTGVGLPSTPPIGSVPPGQPSPLVPPPVSAPTIPPLPTPNPSPSIVGLPPGPLAAPTFTKSFDPSTTSAGAPCNSKLFTIINNSGIQLTGLSFTDSLPAGLLVATPPNLTNTCVGTPSCASGAALNCSERWNTGCQCNLYSYCSGCCCRLQVPILTRRNSHQRPSSCCSKRTC
jgi:hypothetical protein